ncbi:MAG: hypothetical protein ACI9LM_004390 [Alteromonadaceae bacterium]|jgi:hypothetical protein
MIKKYLLALLWLGLSFLCVVSSYANVTALPIMVSHQLNDFGAAGHINVSHRNESGQYDISWYLNENNGDYIVQEKSSLHDWQEIYSGTNLKTLITKSQSGRFQYRVQSCVLSICSAFIESNFIDVFVPQVVVPIIPAQPDVLLIGNTIVIDWKNSAQSSSYKLEASFNAGEWQDITAQKIDVSNNRLQLNDLAAGLWVFRIIACNSVCVMSESSQQISVAEVIPKNYPSQPITSTTEQLMVVDWQFMPDGGEYTYRAEANLNGGSWRDVTSDITFINANRFELRDLISGEWRVRLVACAEVCFYSSSSAPLWVGKILPAVPTTPTIIVNNTTLVVDWSFVSGKPSYSVESSFNGEAWKKASPISFINANRFELRGLAAGKWQLRMVACLEGCSYSLASTAVWIGGIAPDVPVTPTIAVKDNTLIVDWEFVSGRPSYDVESSFNNGAWKKASPIIFINANRFELRNLAAGEWQIRMVACLEACSYSQASLPVSIESVIPDVPLPPKARVEGSLITVNWDEVVFAEHYELEMSLNNGPWLNISRDLLLISSDNYGKYYRNTFDNGSRLYRVNACNNAGCSAFSSSSNELLTAALKKPTTTVNLNSLVVDWEFVSGEPTYKVESSFNGGPWEQSPPVSFINATRFELRNLPAGEWQVRMVACFEACIFSQASLPVSIGTGLPEVPLPPTARVEGDLILVNWEEVFFADDYELEMSLNNGPWLNISSDALLISSDNYGKYYRNTFDNGSRLYRVNACNNAGCSAFSSSSNELLTAALKKPTTTVNLNSLVVDWEFVSGEPTYKVESSFNGGPWEQSPPVSFINATRFELRNLPAGEWQVRMVACFEACIFSQASLPVSIGTGLPEVPLPPTARVEGDLILVNWEEVFFADDYELEMSLNNGPWLNISSDVLMISSDNYNKNYRNTFDNGSRLYRVNACNNAGCSEFSASSNELLTVALKKPTTTVNLNTLVVDWEFVSGEPTYKVESSFNGGPWEQSPPVSFINATRFELRNLPAGEWQVRMIACFEACIFSQASLPVSIESDIPTTKIKSINVELLGTVVEQPAEF